jgi:hypothetical protein
VGPRSKAVSLPLPVALRAHGFEVVHVVGGSREPVLVELPGQHFDDAPLSCAGREGDGFAEA